jgi:hypothetical protein
MDNMQRMTRGYCTGADEHMAASVVPQTECSKIVWDCTLGRADIHSTRHTTFSGCGEADECAESKIQSGNWYVSDILIRVLRY